MILLPGIKKTYNISNQELITCCFLTNKRIHYTSASTIYCNRRQYRVRTMVNVTVCNCKQEWVNVLSLHQDTNTSGSRMSQWVVRPVNHGSLRLPTNTSTHKITCFPTALPGKQGTSVVTLRMAGLVSGVTRQTRTCDGRSVTCQRAVSQLHSAPVSSGHFFYLCLSPRFHCTDKNLLT